MWVEMGYKTWYMVPVLDVCSWSWTNEDVGLFEEIQFGCSLVVAYKFYVYMFSITLLVELRVELTYKPLSSIYSTFMLILLHEARARVYVGC